MAKRLWRWWKKRKGLCTWTDRCATPHHFEVVTAYDSWGDDEDEAWTMEGLSCTFHAREQVEHFLTNPNRGDRLHLSRRF